MSLLSPALSAARAALFPVGEASLNRSSSIGLHALNWNQTSSCLVADRSYLSAMVHTLQVYILTSHNPSQEDLPGSHSELNRLLCNQHYWSDLKNGNGNEVTNQVLSKKNSFEKHMFSITFQYDQNFNSFKQVDLSFCHARTRGTFVTPW